jgi:recombination protein RecA
MPIDKERQKLLEATVATIDRQFGKGSIMMLGEHEHPTVEVISSGSVGLDIAMGVGGFPRGRICEIYGRSPRARRRSRST